MRPRRSLEIETLLDQVARMKSEIPTYEELERKTGLCVGYLRAVISAKVRELSNKNVVSRGA